MALPINAKVEATPNFLANLETIHQFFLTQDTDTADARFAKLKADLREMIAVLAWSPAGGRPARFLMAKSAQVRLKSDAVQRLAEQAGLPYLREYVVGQHLVLYVHAEAEVVLLAVKHQRQLTYAAADLAVKN
jgi:plasmid stabilization system protein ParE